MQKTKKVVSTIEKPLVQPAPKSVEVYPEVQAESQKSNLPMPLIFGGLFALVLIGVLAALSLVFAARSIGNDSFFSRTAQHLPLEQYRVFTRFRKSNAQLLSDALVSEVDPNRITKLGGQKVVTNMNLEISGEQSTTNAPFTFSANASTTTQLGTHGQPSTIHSEVGGKAVEVTEPQNAPNITDDIRAMMQAEIDKDQAIKSKYSRLR